MARVAAGHSCHRGNLAGTADDEPKLTSLRCAGQFGAAVGVLDQALPILTNAATSGTAPAGADAFDPLFRPQVMSLFMAKPR